MFSQKNFFLTLIFLTLLLSGCISSNSFNEFVNKNSGKPSKDAVKKIEPIEIKKVEPVIFNTTFKKEDPCLMDGNANVLFVGKWRPYSKTIYFAEDDWKTLISDNGVLALCKDFTWSFGDLSGTWEEKEIEENDWSRWETIAPTRTMGEITRKDNLLGKIVLNGWETDSTSFVDGPLESLSRLWIYYTDSFEGRPGKMQLEFKKILPEYE